MRLSLIALPLVLGACAFEGNIGHSGYAGLPFMGGYRSDVDQCRHVGEDAFTRQYLRRGADLVACPVDMEGKAMFERQVAAYTVAEVPDYTLYSIRRR